MGDSRVIPQEPLAPFQRNMMLLVMTTGAFFTVLSQSMLTSALPVIMAEFTISATLGQWLTTIYIMVLGVVTSATAYLINTYHTKKLFLTAMILFLCGTLASYFAPTFTILLASRVMQAAGAGILMPMIQVIGFQTIPAESRGRAMGLLGLVVAFAPAIGPVLSGVIVDAWGWRTIFSLLSIGSVIVIAVALLFVTDIGEKIKTRMDLASATIYGAAFTLMMLGVTNREALGFFDLRTMLPLLAGAFLLAMFVRRQLQQPEPLLKLRVFRNRQFAVATVLNIISYLIMMSGTILIPIYIISVRELPALTSGMVLLPGAFLLAVMSPVSGYLMDRYGSRLAALAGMAMMMISAGAFVFFSTETPLWLVTTMYALRMTGVAAVLMPLTAYGIGILPKEDLAHGTAVITSLRQMSGALGSAMLVSAMSAASTIGTIPDISGIKIAFLIQTLLTAWGLLLGIKYIH